MRELSRTKTLTAIFSDVLADLAFMFTDDDPSDTEPGEVWLETIISYRGPVVGTLKFRCTRGFSLLLAANLLGIDAHETTDPLQCEDAVKEFMNIVCGHFVTISYGSDDVFNLSIPHIAELPQAPDLQEADEERSATLSVDQYRLQLIHQTEEGGN